MTLRAATILAMTLALTACGFRPMYTTGGVTPALTRIAVPTPSGRTGHYLREQLDDQLATDRTQPARYRLTLDYDEDRAERGLRIDNTANRYEVVLLVNYALFDVTSGAQVVAGSVRPQVSFDSADQPYQGIVGNLDASERAASEAARLIRLELARHFALQTVAAAP